VPEIVIIIIAAYLIGSIPVGITVARFFGGKDVTKEGSGNIGATNVGRVAGKKAGIITLFGDILKGIIPLLLSFWIAGDAPDILSFVALAAFLGHLYPLFNRFKGGKGVATALGIFIVLTPSAVIIAFIIFGITLYIWRYVSLSSMTAACAIPILVGIFSFSYAYIFLSLTIGGLVIFRHMDNIKRLLNGEESRFGIEKAGERKLENCD